MLTQPCDYVLFRVDGNFKGTVSTFYELHLR